MAQTEEPPWQAVVTGQIEAFRSGDGAAALEFAGAGFRARYSDPALFYADILRSGYRPIVESRSHSFGEATQVSDTAVLQVVRFVGPDLGLYEALYQLADEPDAGWRVQGVMLRRDAGVGI
ncbi:DUF4864 domain-containing protein [Devosia limi]|nr:DUF4864 domain-containing protein [Devosia limi]